MVRSLVPWEARTPLLMFDNFRREMDQLMNQFFGAEDGGERAAWFTPRCDIAETDKEYEITVDLPGLRPEEFNVELKERALWITGQRKEEKEEKGRTWHRTERYQGEFRRVIPLEMDVKPEEIEADYREGVLHLRLPKSEAVRPHKIPVKL